MDGVKRLAPPELDAQRSSRLERLRWLPDYPNFGHRGKLHRRYSVRERGNGSLQRFLSALDNVAADRGWLRRGWNQSVFRIGKLHAGGKLALRGKLIMHNYSHIFRKRTVTRFAAILALALPAGAQVDFGLSPMKVEIPAVAGKPYSGSLALTNGASVKTRVRAELLDLYVDETTTPQFVASAPGEAEYSCRSWLSVNPMELEIEPRSQVLVRYSVRVPGSASQRSHHCALGFRTLPAPSEASGASMATAVRMITVFYLTIGNPAIDGVIKDVKLEQVPDGSGTHWRAIVIMENSGLMLYRPAGDIEIVDASGKVMESLKMSSVPALPKRQQRYVLPIKTSLSPGPYTLRARIEVGGEIQEASVAVTAEAAAPADVIAKTPAQ